MRELNRLFIINFVAGAIALWDFELVESNKASIPRPQFSAGVALPDADVRVKVKKRVPAKEEGITDR